MPGVSNLTIVAFMSETMLVARVLLVEDMRLLSNDKSYKCSAIHSNLCSSSLKNAILSSDGKRVGVSVLWT